MTNEERDIIGNFVARISGAAAPASPWGGASVPATTAPSLPPALPPVDRDADQFIGEQFQHYPDARYRMTQLAFVQEHALIEAQNRIKRLEWELQQAQQAAAQGSRAQQGGGFFSGLFGGGHAQQSAPPPRPAGPPSGYGGPPPGYQPGYQGGPPPPQYPPGYNTGMFQRSGSGFLGSALTTAAGVAGGVLAADAIQSMFSPHRSFGGFGAGGMPMGGSPWAAPGADPGYVDQGAWTAPDPGAGGQPDQGYVDSGTWDQGGQGGADQSAWNDPGSSDPSGGDPSGGGWDQGGADDPGFDPGGGGTDDSIL